MTWWPPAPRPGDPLRANRQREVERDLHSALTGSHAFGPHSTDTGHGLITAQEYPQFGLFQIPLQGTWTCNTADTAHPHQWAYMADCQRVWYDSEARNYVPVGIGFVGPEVLWHPSLPDNHGAAVRAEHAATAASGGNLFPAKFGPGDWVWAHFNIQAGRWEILQAYEDHWRFEVHSQTITLGGSGTVTLVLFNHTTNLWVKSGITFTVYDSLNGGPYAVNSRGVAKRFGDSDRWEILTRIADSTAITATHAVGTLCNYLCPDNQITFGDSSSSSGASSSSGSSSGSSSYCAPGDITGFQTTDYPTEPAGPNPRVIENRYKLCGQTGDKVAMFWDRISQTWVIHMVTHRFRTVVVDHRDEANCVQLKFQLICVPTCDEDFVWEDLLCGVPCSSSSGQ